ncbi:hypothetical protein ILUMI_15077 [Ignelater luminosus]|uniref:HTH psq-type domain-containing protein n=1 Tax=Ignelater luminosus TaxID=2038154 RepID=A0A8K0CT00_IGNLU|nr:hypothetical protein ILUMI_15077 [Ignelater luminosus]
MTVFYIVDATKLPKKDTLENLEKATESVRNNVLTLGKAASAYSVPKSTLHDHLKKEVIQQPKCGRKTIFSEQQKRNWNNISSNAVNNIEKAASGFQAAGILPLNPNKFDDQLLDVTSSPQLPSSNRNSQIEVTAEAQITSPSNLPRLETSTKHSIIITSSPMKNILEETEQKKQVKEQNLEKTESKTETKNKNKKELAKRLENLGLIWDDFNACQLRIETIGNDETQAEHRTTFENSYFDNVARVEQYMANSRLQNNITETTSSNSAILIHSNVLNNVKLPTLKLIEFKEAHTESTQFIDSSNALEHNNPTLSNIQKFLYLKSCLKVEPLQVISSVQVTDSNYSTALDLLRERYENKRVIVNNQVKRIVEAPALHKESANGLRRLLDEFLTNTCGLKNLGEQIENWGSILIYLISSKLYSATKKSLETVLED